MKTKTVCSFFVLFAIVAGIGATTPAAFADPHPIDTADTNLASPGCLETEVGCYTPNITTVEVGHVITMANLDNTGIHTFTSGTVDGFAASPDGIFDSGMLNAGESFEYTADTVGEFPYYCILHVWMQGVLVVQEAAAQEEMQMEEENQIEVTLEEEISVDVSSVEETIEEEVMMEEQMPTAPIELDQIMAEIQTSDGAANESMTIDLTLTDLDGNGIEHITYNIKAMQGSDVVLDEESHMHKGTITNTHTTDMLSMDASESMPVVITVESVGFGHDEQYVAVSGDIATKQVVPEFGTIAMMVLAVAIISIVAVTAKSRVVPRF